MVDLALDSIVLDFFRSGLAGTVAAFVVLAILIWVVWVYGLTRD